MASRQHKDRGVSPSPSVEKLPSASTKEKPAKKLTLWKKVKRGPSLKGHKTQSSAGWEAETTDNGDLPISVLDSSPKADRVSVNEASSVSNEEELVTSIAADSKMMSESTEHTDNLSNHHEEGGSGEEEVTVLPAITATGHDRNSLSVPSKAHRSKSVENIPSKQGLSRQSSLSVSPHSKGKYAVTVHLKSGHDLVARDSNGLSDPYVKLKMGLVDGYSKVKSTIMYKTLTPIWNETFTLAVLNLEDPLLIRVYDKDFMTDDFMGRHILHLGSLPINKTVEKKLFLDDPDGDVTEDYGYLMAEFTLRVDEDEDSRRSVSSVASSRKVAPSSSDSDILRHESIHSIGSAGGSLAGSLNAGSNVQRRLSRMHLPEGARLPKPVQSKKQVMDSILSITLLSGTGLSAMDDNGFSDPYVKFRLGAQKRKSRVIDKTLNPEWKQQFELRLEAGQEDTILNVSVYDHDYSFRDDFMGSLEVDVFELEPDITHRIDKPLQGGEGSLLFLLTITGMKDDVDGADEGDPLLLQRECIQQSYNLRNTMKALDDVGIVMVKVIRAMGLKETDSFSGTSDPFCNLELGNTRVRTETIFKTCAPEWNKIFFLKVKDIHSLVNISVMSEDRAGEHTFLGRLSIPLLSVSPGEEKWYALKDKKLHGRLKGQLLLSFDLIYNPVRASIRTFNPKEQKYLEEEEKFNRQILAANVSRVAAQVRSIRAFIEFINSLFLWKSKLRSLTALLAFVIIALFFELWMVFACILLAFFQQHYANSVGSGQKRLYTPEEVESDEDMDEKDKKGLLQRLQEIYQICQMVQNVLDQIAAVGERVKNTVNWTVPFQSWLAMVVFTAAMLITYVVPLRYLILLWGINKFTKKLRNPNFIPNNEALDFLSRLPSDPELLQWSSLSIQEEAQLTQAATKRKKKKRA